MNADIRLSVEFLDHPKTVKLQRRLGLEAVFCLLRLWTWAAQNRSDGTLHSMDAESIEIAARWQGSFGAFVETLVSLSFIDECDGLYSLHNWAVHQTYVANEQERVEKARKAAQARWGNKQALPEEKNSNAQKDNDLCSGDATSNAQSMPEESPSNAPIRSDPEEENTGGVGYCARPHEANSVPGEAGASSKEQPASTGKPKHTDSPSKGHPQWSAFQACFAVYPVKQGQEDAWREWMRLWENRTLPEPYVIRDAILLLIAEDTRWQRGKVPEMARWLKGKRWEDKPYTEPQELARPSPPAQRPLTAAQETRALKAQTSLDVLKGREAIRNGSQNPYGNGIGGDVLTLPPAPAR